VEKKNTTSIRGLGEFQTVTKADNIKTRREPIGWNQQEERRRGPAPKEGGDFD